MAARRDQSQTRTDFRLEKWLQRAQVEIQTLNAAKFAPDCSQSGPFKLVEMDRLIFLIAVLPAYSLRVCVALMLVIMVMMIHLKLQ